MAAGLIAGRTGLVKPPVNVIPASGDTLVVDFVLTADGAEKVTLFGPAAHVFKGELGYEGAVTRNR